jgi:zinc-ribbon domain
MYCPDCGTENSSGQKFCTRCGTNLKAIESARSIVTEVGEPGATNQVDKASLLRTIQWISALGFFLLTMGTIIILSIEPERMGGPPLSFFFPLIGFISLVMIVRRLIRMLDTSHSLDRANMKGWMKSVMEKKVAEAHAKKMGGTTQQLPPVDTMPYSVVEEKTRQFEK